MPAGPGRSARSDAPVSFEREGSTPARLASALGIRPCRARDDAMVSGRQRWHRSPRHHARTDSRLFARTRGRMIDGVKIVPLRQIVDERGKVMHMLRSDADHFQGFGEIYFSAVHPGAVKAWHLHKKMVLNYAVPVGCIKLVLFDDRPNSATKGRIIEMFLGPDNYNLVIIPALVWNGFKGVGPGT